MNMFPDRPHLVGQSYIINAKNFVRDKFSWAGTPTKIKPMKICTHKELATVITMSYSHPQKFIPSKFNPGNTVYVQIFAEHNFRGFRGF